MIVNKFYNEICFCIHSKYIYLTKNYVGLCLFLIGFLVLTAGLNGLASAENEGANAQDIIKEQMCKIESLLEGAFGALVMVVAGLAAVVTAAMGAYKMAMSCVVIACDS
jgi:hypothetical protein